MFGHYGGYHSPPCVFSMPQQAPESQHSQGYKIQISYACISCAPEKAPEFGTFSTLATALIAQNIYINCAHITGFLLKLVKHTQICKIVCSFKKARMLVICYWRTFQVKCPAFVNVLQIVDWFGRNSS